ncbi:Lipase [Thalassocella blandensis]|nr:Lipase [Thalassocella blandensis]
MKITGNSAQQTQTTRSSSKNLDLKRSSTKKSKAADQTGTRSVKVNKQPKFKLNPNFNLTTSANNNITYKNAKNYPTGAKDWSTQDTKICSQLADFVYNPKNENMILEGKSLTPLSSQITHHGLHQQNGLFTDKKTDGQAMAWESNDKVFVAFRGTESLQDAKQDLLIGLTDKPNDVFDNFMLSTAKYAKKSGKQLVITGHSLGGYHVNSFASKAAKSEQFANLKDASFIGFASPQFAKKANVLNIGMKNDPVFGVLATATHGYMPSNSKSGPQFVEGMQYTANHTPGKSVSAHLMANIQEAVNGITSQTGKGSASAATA